MFVRNLSKINRVNIKNLNNFQKNFFLLKNRSFTTTNNNNNELIGVVKQDSYAIVSLQRAPANALNLELLRSIATTIDNLEKDESCRGLILTSNVPRIFSAGLDITEFCTNDKTRLADFWRNLQEAYLRLYGSRLVTIAAINGAAPAGGCLLSLSCDYRIMSNGFKIGLNETQLGIVAPFWFMETMLSVLGRRSLVERLLQLGEMLPANDAHSIGMVDVVTETPDLVLPRAQEEMKKWLQINDYARYQTKLLMRKNLIEKLKNNRENDIQQFCDLITQPPVQKVIKAYLANLAKPKK
eukprot:TRINITY_DN4303_c3_g1_i1.p1 TRINITY_DN4303_c3_g1~~TRINITY_DN4303_c3_g1_i1.p1  ORF type:complete len:297 (+),score=145.40 TRINITY_DN4303_c3_g1_i1:92-982(+)